MKTYSEEEKKEAETHIPKSTSDFLHSGELAATYADIGKSTHLNLRQTELVVEAVQATLLGLEPESKLEGNLHDALPELSVQASTKLVSELNERVFGEARKRLMGERGGA